MKDENKDIAYIFVGLSVGITGIFLLRIWVDGCVFWNKNVSYEATGQIGDFIGGVVGTIISAAGFIYLYYTFNSQREAFQRERLENKFFDLIKLHRENVNELKFDATKLAEDDDSLFIEKVAFEGKSVFKVIFNQVIMCRNELRPLFKRQKVHLPEYEDQLLKNPFIIKNKLDIDLLAQIDICYCIVFYGLSSEGLLLLEDLFKNRYKPEFIKVVLRFISLKPANDNQILIKWIALTKSKSRRKIVEMVEAVYSWRRNKASVARSPYSDFAQDYHNRYTKYYGGHQFRLGHYFRHLFNTVKFINLQSHINYAVKYDYIKTLRSQLSTYEQAVLFLNSASALGEAWEINPESSTSKDFSYFDFELITKYNLIKNIPGNSIYGIPFKYFYPNIEYESDNIKKQRHNYK